jgi:hypothetical protein
MKIVMLVLSLPTGNGTARQRIWRALKALGAASLRDGVYVLPDEEQHRDEMRNVEAEVISGGGTAHVLLSATQDSTTLLKLFDRSVEYDALMAEIEDTRRQLEAQKDESGLLKRARKLRRAFTELASIDFFPGLSHTHAGSALTELEHALARAMTPGEPCAASGVIQRLRMEDHRGRQWATRQRPWVDRLASAWLIRRFIDPEATILWLEKPNDCPGHALGFDFDGATFSHVEGRVTFEVLLASFGLDHPGLFRLGQTVHYLDVGGIPTPEAPGLEAMLSGLRANAPGDDALLEQASLLFDGLLAHFNSEAAVR